MSTRAARDRIAAITAEECAEFRANPRRNPLTRRAIPETGPTASALRQRCDEAFPQQTREILPHPSFTIKLRWQRIPLPVVRLNLWDIGHALANNTTQVTLGGHQLVEEIPTAMENTATYVEKARDAFGNDWVNYWLASGRTSDEVRPSRFARLGEDISTLPQEPDYHGNGNMMYQHSNGTNAVPIAEAREHLMHIGAAMRNETPVTIPYSARAVHLTTRTAKNFLDTAFAAFGYPWVDYWLFMGYYLPSTPDIQKERFSSPTSMDDTQIEANCNSFLAGIASQEFRPFANKLKKICNHLSKECTGGSIAQLRDAVKAPLNNVPLKITNIDQSATWRSFLNIALALNGRLYDVFANSMFQGSLPNLIITFEGQEGIGAGVTRTFIKLILDNIISDGFFVPVEEGSQRHVLNPDISVQSLKRMGYTRIKNEEDIHTVYQWIGKFIAMCIREDIPVPIYFSRAILAQMIFKDDEMQPEEYVMYHLMDAPQTATGLVNLMRAPQDIEYTGIEFNDEFPLVPPAENAELNASNFRKYLQLRARHQLLHQIRGDATDTKPRLAAFVKGFYLRNRLRKQNANVTKLDKLISGNPITIDSIRDWLTPTRITCPVLNESNAAHQQLARILGWFKEILQDEGRTFPFAELGMPASANPPPEDRKRIYLEFIGKLMFFWTSLQKLDTVRNYQVIFIPNPIPKSSTCFFQIKLPAAITSREELYRKLVLAVYAAEAGVGLFGGAKKKERTSITRAKSKTTNK